MGVVRLHVPAANDGRRSRMTEITELRPRERPRVIDLVRAAGVDVSDWSNFKGGAARAALNPKYCYEWSFLQPGKLAVLSLWHASMRNANGAITQDLNFRESADRYRRLPNRAVWEKRAQNMDHTIQTAYKQNLPVRVIVCDGLMRNRNDPTATASRVDRRGLDPVPWAVTAYDDNSGACTVTRGATPERLVDQFSLPQDTAVAPEQRIVATQVFLRDASVRRRVLIRAGGKCEWCSAPGFAMADGSVFLETHHVVPLAEGGHDTERNVVALCPNHHREAHHGARSHQMRYKLLELLRRK